MPFVTAGGHRLHYEWIGAQPGAGPGAGQIEAPTIVILHEGLGSVEMWKDFPRKVHDATGLGVVTYSRWGYGQSDPFHDYPREVDYMTGEAREGLRDFLRALGIGRPILLGHSDGASIAIIYAGSDIAPKPLGLILMAPHVFVEQVSTDSIASARVAYEAEGLKARLARYHADVDSAFYGWNTIWLLPQFIADWNIESHVDAIDCPITVIQGADDEYGTDRQLNSISAHSGGKAAIVLLPECRHSPHRDQPEATLAAIVEHVVTVSGKVAA